MTSDGPRTRWNDDTRPGGDDYDARWRSLAERGHNIHGEADLVEALLRESGGSRVLDAGCGTGRVAIELAERGFSVSAVDADAQMIATARRKRPDLDWVEADLATYAPPAGRRVDLALLAGNVMIFVGKGTEGQVLGTVAAHCVPGGLLVAGFQLLTGRLGLDTYDALAAAAGLRRVDRWATWDRKPYDGGEYAVSVHRREG